MNPGQCQYCGKFKAEADCGYCQARNVRVVGDWDFAPLAMLLAYLVFFGGCAWCWNG